MKKILAVLLTLALLVCAVPFASARVSDHGWRVYCEEAGETAFTATVVAPANYTRFSSAPQLETVFTTDHDEISVSAPETGTVLYYAGGKTETRLTMRVTCELPDESVTDYNFTFAVPAGTVLDDAGNANSRIHIAEEEFYLSAEGFAEIDVYSRLLLHDYSIVDDTVAVGDTLRVEYFGLYPVEIRLNGTPAATLQGGEKQVFTYNITETGTVSVAVIQNGKELEARALTVITSEEMYERNLQEALPSGEDIPSVEDLTQPGVPIGNPFLPFGLMMSFLNRIGSFFHRLFSFFRITK